MAKAVQEAEAHLHTTGDVIPQRSVVFMMSARAPGNHRSVNSAKVNGTDADPSMLRMSKTLLNSPELGRVKQLDGRVRTWVRSHTLPSMLRDGLHVLPHTLIERVEEKMQSYRVERAKLIEEFIDEYPNRIKESKTKLGELFDPSDYPPASAIRMFFRVETRYIPAGIIGNAADELRQVSEELYKVEQAKAQASWTIVLERARNILRTRMKEVVGRFIARLQPDASGGKKVFRDSLVPNFLDALDLLTHCEITDDGMMQDLVAKSRQLVGSIGDTSIAASKFLRDWKPARDEMAAAFTKVETALDKMVVDAPARYMDLD